MRLLELAQLLLDLGLGRVPASLVETGEYLVQGPKRLFLEPQALRRRGRPERRRHGPAPRVSEPCRPDYLLKDAGVAEAE